MRLKIKKEIFILGFISIFIWINNLFGVGLDGTYRLGINKKAAANSFLKFQNSTRVNRSIAPQPVNRDVLGDQKSFFSYNFETGKYEVVQATLRKVGGHCYIYVANDQFNVNVTTANVESIANTFDSKIYPTATSYFGNEWNPGIDNDTRITIFITDIKDGWPSSQNFYQGYFSFLDELPDISAQQPPHNARSNEREMFYMDCYPAVPASDTFMETLAHEFQHMIHWHQNPNEEAWLDEGMSDLSSYLCGYGLMHDHFDAFYKDPTKKLLPFDGTLAAYGASFSFVLYLFEHYGGSNDTTKKNFTKKLANSGDKGIGSVNSALAYAGYPDVTFNDVFKDYSTMLAIDYTGVSKYSFSAADFRAKPLFTHSGYPVRDRNWDVENWGRQYVLFENGEAESKVLKFMGAGDKNFALRMVLFNKDGTITVDDVKLNNKNDGFYDMWGLGKNYNKALMIVMYLKESGTTGFRYNVGYAGPKAGIYPNPIFPDDIMFMVNSYIPPEVWVKRAGGSDEKISMKYLEKGSYTGYYHVNNSGNYDVTIHGEDEEGLEGTIYTSFTIQKLNRYVLNMIAFDNSNSKINLSISPESSTDGSLIIKKGDEKFREKIEESGLKYISGVNILFNGSGNLKRSTISFNEKTIPEKSGIIVEGDNGLRWINSSKTTSAIKAPFENFRAHALVVDNVPPFIDKCTENGSEIEIKCHDIGSGISKSNSEIRINGKKQKFTISSDNMLKVKNIEKNIDSLAITLSDNCGNVINRMVQINRAHLPGKNYSIYPNPAKTYVTFDLTGGSLLTEIKIYDSSSHIIFKKIVTGSRFIWDLKNSKGRIVSNGTYFADIRDKKLNQSDRIKFSIIR